MASAEVILHTLEARFEELKREVVIRVEATIRTLFHAYKTTRDVEIQRMFDVLFAREQAHINEYIADLEKSFRNRVTADVLLDADPSLPPCDKNNLLSASNDVADWNFQTYCAQDQLERAPLYCVRFLRSKTTATLPCAADTSDVSRFLHCDPSSIAHVEQFRANGKGKPRMLVHFTSGQAAKAAYNSFRASSNSSTANMEYKRTFLQNTLVDLAIQLQKVARDTGMTDASFQARGNAIMFQEGQTTAPKEYPFIKHFWAGRKTGGVKSTRLVRTCVDLSGGRGFEPLRCPRRHT